MPTLICGSLAFDTIMLFPDRFKNYILPDQIHILNVCFVIQSYVGSTADVREILLTTLNCWAEIHFPWELWEKILLTIERD